MPPSHEVLKKLYYFNKRKKCFLSYKSTVQVFHNMPLMNLYSLLSNIIFIQSQGSGKQAKARNDNKSVNFRRSVVFFLHFIHGTQWFDLRARKTKSILMPNQIIVDHNADDYVGHVICITSYTRIKRSSVSWTVQYQSAVRSLATHHVQSAVHPTPAAGAVSRPCHRSRTNGGDYQTTTDPMQARIISETYDKVRWV